MSEQNTLLIINTTTQYVSIQLHHELHTTDQQSGAILLGDNYTENEITLYLNKEHTESQYAINKHLYIIVDLNNNL